MTGCHPRQKDSRAYSRTAGSATRYRLPTLTKNAAVCAHNDSLYPLSAWQRAGGGRVPLPLVRYVLFVPTAPRGFCWLVCHPEG